MSFKTAFASCWDVFKHNCKNPLPGLPEFNLDLYEKYYDFSDDLDYPYNEKPRRSSTQRGITEIDDKLVSAFLGWIFTIPEMLLWAAVMLGMTVASIFALLLLVMTALTAPIFLLIRDLRIYLNYTKFLQGTWEFLRHSALFALLSLLRVPYHLLKALVRIPVGIFLGVREIVSPSHVLEANSEDANDFERRDYLNSLSDDEDLSYVNSIFSDEAPRHEVENSEFQENDLYLNYYSPLGDNRPGQIQAQPDSAPTSTMRPILEVANDLEDQQNELGNSGFPGEENDVFSAALVFFYYFAELTLGPAIFEDSSSSMRSELLGEYLALISANSEVDPDYLFLFLEAVRIFESNRSLSNENNEENDFDRTVRNSDYENHAPSDPVQVAQTSNLYEELEVTEIPLQSHVSEDNSEDANGFEDRSYLNSPISDEDLVYVRSFFVQPFTRQVMPQYTSDAEDELSHEVETSSFEENGLNETDEESDLDRAIRNSDDENHAPSAPVQVAQTNHWDEGLIKLLETIQIPSRYLCSISRDLIDSPFLIADGHFYNRSHIEAHFASSGLKSPLTRKPIPNSNPQGIVLESVQAEIKAFANALQKKHDSDGEKGVAEVLAIADKVGKQADELHVKINEHIKKMPSTGSTNDYLIVSSSAIAKAWSYVKTLTRSSTDPNLVLTLTMPPEEALKSFFTLIEEIDSSFDNLIINALREAILEEQQVAKEFDKTWQKDVVNTLKASSDLPNDLSLSTCAGFGSV